MAGAEQSAFPWRGRISCYPQSAEKTDAVIAQIDNFFGSALAGHFDILDGLPNYTAPDEFSYRRFILHYAKLAQISGSVDRFVIGSEMRGITTLRDSNSHYPAVQKLTELAQDVRSLLGAQTQLTYAADWSEYFGHHPQDGSGDVSFHLDALWSSSAIDAIGIDAYFPLSDWREGKAHLDVALADTPYEKTYLQSQMEGGEGYDYYYGSLIDRETQNRIEITDGASVKPWVFRYKDIRNWWSQRHYNRRNGVEGQMPTAWTPQSKPIWLMEIGCPAINKGANQPNVFYDAKSSETNIPYFSNGARDDLIQRRYLEAFIDYWVQNNQISSVYGGAMIDLDMINVWAWDARPFPDFPARSNIWSDGENRERGHWLSGRTGLVPLSDVVSDICFQSGLDEVDTSHVTGLVQGYHLDRPMTGRAALTPLSALYGFNLIESGKGLRFVSEAVAIVTNLTLEDLVGDVLNAVEIIKADPELRLKDARIHFIDASNDYQLGLASARNLSAETVRIADINAPIVMDRSFARLAAERVLARNIQSDETLSFSLASHRLNLEVGDYLSLPDLEGQWQIQSLEGLTTLRVSANLAPQNFVMPPSGAVPAVTGEPLWSAKPILFILDIPGHYDGLLVGVVSDPFSAATVTGPDREVSLNAPVQMGALLTPMSSGPIGRWDNSQIIDILLPQIEISSLSDTAIFAGGNKFAVETETGWEVFQAAKAELIGQNTYRLSKLLRGVGGSAVNMAETINAGARVTFLGRGWQSFLLPETYIGESVTLTAKVAGRESAPEVFSYSAQHLRPLAPVHVAFELSDQQGKVSWIRQSRIEGESWAGMEVPLGEETEQYRVQCLSGGNIMSDYEVTQTQIILSQSVLEITDQIVIAQGSRAFGWGARTIIDIPSLA